MTYRITNTATYTKNLGEFTSQNYIAGINYADISGDFPEITEADWPAIKAEIINYVKLPLLTVGEVPGLVSYVEDLAADHGNITLEFVTKADYLAYAAAQIEKGPVHGIMIKFEAMAQSDASSDFVLEGRTLNGNVELEIGKYLTVKYAIYRGIIRTCVHETI